MTACIYYDVEDVVEDDIQHGADAAGPGHPVHIRRSDARWPSTGPEPETLLAGHDSQFRAKAMDILDRWIVAARARPAWRQALTYAGVDLLEAARYDWLSLLLPHLHRAWVVDRILRRHEPHTIVWVARDTPPGLGPFAVQARQVLAASGVRFHLVHPSGTRVAARRPALRLARAMASATKVVALLAAPRRRPLVGVSRSRGLILFVEEYPHCAKVLVAPARVLEAERGLDVVFAAGGPAVLDQAASLRNAFLLTELASRRDRVAALRKRAAVRRVAGAISASLVDGDLAWRDGIGSLLKPGVAKATTGALEKAAWWTPLCHGVVRAWNPNAVAASAHTGNSLQRAATLCGREAGSTTFFVQHGIVSPDAWKLRLLQDRYLVWGARAQRTLVQAGVPADDIAVTGSSKIEAMVTRARQRARTERVVGGLRVAYLPSRGGDGGFVSRANAARMLTTVVSAVDRTPGARLVVKVHPLDRSSIFDELEHLGRVEVVRGADPAEVMLEADVVVVAISTAGFEACALDLPVVLLRWPGGHEVDGLHEYGATLCATDAEELRQCLHAVDRDDEVRARLRAGRGRMIEDVFGGAAPGALERIVGQIAERTSDGGGSPPRQSVTSRHMW